MDKQQTSKDALDGLKHLLDTLPDEHFTLERHGLVTAIAHLSTTEARDGELWRKLNADCNEVPCSFPCLRDDLHDWISAIEVESGQAIAATEGK